MHKSVQRKYKTRYHWELCKKLKFDHVDEWYEYIPESVLENEKNEIQWNFEKQTDHRISARLPNLVIVNKKKRVCRLVDFALPADHRVKLKKTEKRDKYQDLARELKKTVEHKSDGDTNCNWCTRYSHQWISTGTRVLGNRLTSWDHPNSSIVEIGQNTEKSPGDVKRLAVTQTPVENYQLTLVGRTLKWVE